MRSRRILSAGLRSVLALGLTVGAFVGFPTSGAVSAQNAAPDVVVVGDSITAMNVPRIEEILADAGQPSVHFEALGARRIAESYEWHGWRSSGLDAIARVRESGLDPDLWIVELGTNELPLVEDCRCRDRLTVASALIDQVLVAVGPGEEIIWVTVLNRDDPDSTRVFNTALRLRAAGDPRMELLDWQAAAADHPEWFMDHVHPNRVGAGRLAGLYVEGIERAVGESIGHPPAFLVATPLARV